METDCLAANPAAAAAENATGPAIVVDTDTLIRSDLFVEMIARAISLHPGKGLRALAEVRRGKAALKAALAREAAPDVALLPYDQDVLAWLADAKSSGARLYLVSASNERLVAAIANHLGLFENSMGSTDEIDLSGGAKLARIAHELGEQPFTYVGSSRADLPLWRAAAHCVALKSPANVQRQLRVFAPDAIIVGGEDATFWNWIRLVRVRQYVKNALVAVPLVVSHQISLANIALTIAAALSFSFCASAVYIMNDLADVDADRRHPSKRRRPLAAGTVSVRAAPFVSIALLVAAFAVAACVNWLFVLILVFYLILTTAYTLSLKRKMVIDSIVLAMLYSARVLAGASAISVVPSEWLLSFSLFIFSSLAFIKRYVELAFRSDEGKQTKLNNRNYEVGDLKIVGAMAAACGFNAITFLALYISSQEVRQLYHHPQFLWIACPVMMYWLGRNLLLAHRRLMDDDPIVFALSDKPSLACAGVIAIAAVLATL